MTNNVREKYERDYINPLPGWNVWASWDEGSHAYVKCNPVIPTLSDIEHFLVDIKHLERLGSKYKIYPDKIRYYPGMNSLIKTISVWIPAKAVGSYQYDPGIGLGEIIDVYWAQDGIIMAEELLFVKVKNKLGRATLTIEAESDLPYLYIDGTPHYKTLDEGEETTIAFRCKNLGPPEDTTGTITIKVKDKWGNVDDEATITVTLKANPNPSEIEEEQEANEQALQPFGIPWNLIIGVSIAVAIGATAVWIAKRRGKR